MICQGGAVFTLWGIETRPKNCLSVQLVSGIHIVAGVTPGSMNLIVSQIHQEGRNRLLSVERVFIFDQMIANRALEIDMVALDILQALLGVAKGLLHQVGCPEKTDPAAD